MKKENGVEAVALQTSDCDSDLKIGAWWSGRYFKNKKGYIHRHVANRIFGQIPTNTVVDHINRNSADNRRENLRVVSQSTNVRNSNGKSSIRKSKYRGVFMARNKWAAQITIAGKRTHLGTFDTEYAAFVAYKTAEQIYCGLAGKP